MGLKDVGVRFVTEGLAQFNAALGSANKSVAGVGTAATKTASTVQSKMATVAGAFVGFATGFGIQRTLDTLKSVGMAAKNLADGFQDYAFQVEDFGRIIGATPEQASKLIQVADDVRLSVESMTVGLRFAIKNGINPTIENLGKLSDQYLAIQDPIERSRFAIETFGSRAGPQMAKLLKLGSDAIDKMGDSIENTGLLMTSEGIKKAEDYYAALDTLGDTAKGVSIKIGSSLAPAITQTANDINRLTDDIQGSALPAMFALTNAMAGEGVWQTLELWDQYIKGQLTATQVTEMLTQKLKENNDAKAGSGYYTVELLRATDGLTVGTTNLATATRDLAQAEAEANQQLGWASAAISKYVTDSNIARLATDALALATGELTEYDISLRGSIDLLTQMMQSRILTPQQWAGAMALLKDNTLSAAEKVKLLQQYIDGLHNKDITIGVTVLSNLEAFGNSPAGQAAFGAILGWNTGTTTAPKAKTPWTLPINPKTGQPFKKREWYLMPGQQKKKFKTPDGANGLDMIVPSGYRGDTFPIWASSGERVVVMTAQQQREMNRSLFSGMMGSVSQTASPSQIYTNNTSSVNVSMPISATVRNDADIRVLAYAISKEIAANVRA